MSNPVTNNPATSLPVQDLPLRDIHLPDPVSAWPPAIGWWLLPVVIVIIAYAIYAFIKYRKRQQQVAYKKFARKQLHTIQQQYVRDNQPVETLRAVSTLLRRTALSYFPREQVAGLTGDEWIRQLNQLSSEASFTEEQIVLLTRGVYQKPDTENLSAQVSQLLSSCENWMKHLSRPKKIPGDQQ